ncbi:MAG TPA: amidase [Aestuariivirgaceae bacterium]|nr:amidase [Aestuariivirgaceae bacterium]
MNLWDLTAAEMAARVRDKSVSPVDLVQACLERSEAVQPKLNCFCFTFPDEALEAARAAEVAVMRGETLGALHGVPIAIKDFTPTKGKTTTRGSAAFRNWVPDRDAVIVERLANAGAILLGKTTTPEFAFSSFTRSPLWGHTRNPWNASRNAGGSSGGSGVAVATGCVALAEGSDMGGSVRIPAAFCGIVGLKPSLGRIPMDILFTSFDSISHFGPLARTVEDAKLFLEVTQGPHDADIQSQVAPIPLPRQLTGDMTGRRIALSRDLGFIEVAPDVTENLMATARHLEARGAVIEEVALDWSVDVVRAWYAYWGVFLAAGFGDCLERYRDEMDPAVVKLIERGMKMDAVAFKRLEAVRTRQWQALAPILARCDALVCPTMTRGAPETESEETEHVDAQGRLHGLDMTSPFNNVSQCPVLSVPSGFTGDGLPTAVQIVGRRFDDPTVLEIGKAVEACCPAALPSALPL